MQNESSAYYIILKEVVLNFLAWFFEPKPFNSGYLPTKDGHDVFFMEFGNPFGKPIIVTHGGPGGSCKAKYAKVPKGDKYRIIMMDQRGCGKSLPAGKLENNTTADTIDDIARLLDFLQIKEKIVLRGGSWGSTIALLFAEKYPERVEKLLLSQIFLADKANKYWINQENSLFYPDMLERLYQEVENPQNLEDAYSALILSDDAEKQSKAVKFYGNYERVLGCLNPEFLDVDLDEKTLASTRIYIEYAKNNFFLSDNEIMDNIAKIENIPAVLVHNRLDMSCPLIGAYQLHKKMKNSKLVVVPERGHVGKLLYKTIDKEFCEFLRNE